MSEPLRVLVNGARGRMGGFTVRLVEEAEDLVLAGATDLGDDLAGAIRDSGARVVVDFTRPESALPATSAHIPCPSPPEGEIRVREQSSRLPSLRE